ncbi:UNVERIFIED_CONTAM: hypothetical protein PYX00_007542 [Menopon gallinae]|uniref:Pre-mRNA-splicing factor SPF27 n=1 Tax=Menopon gallinae TaxID=328185 RepID=A0AAW2HJQ1_9NEOP
MSQPHEVVVDALPYIDQGYDEPGVREAALAMVEGENPRRYRPTKNYLEHLPPLNLTAFETDIMKTEFERMQQRLPMDMLSMKSVSSTGNYHFRVENLELMLEYGCEAWRSYLEYLVAEVSRAQKKLQAIRKEIQEINWERKSSQTGAGEKLINLESTWVQLVSKNYDIEQACVSLETEIAQLQQVLNSKTSP